MKETVKALIQLSMPSSEVFVESEDEVHFEVIVISQDFEGKSRVNRQQLVYAGVQQAILEGRLHAVALKTYTPEEWKKRKT